MFRVRSLGLRLLSYDLHAQVPLDKMQGMLDFAMG